MADHYNEEREMDAINRALAQKESQDHSDSAKDIEKEKSYDQFKAEASLALREFGRYNWQNVNDPDHCEKPELRRAPMFLHEYGFENWNEQNWLDDILLGGNVKEVSIEYMANAIARCEVQAFFK